MPRELAGARVLLVGDWPPPLGGVSVHVRALRDAAARAGALVTVLDIGKGRNAAPGVVPAGRPVAAAARLFALARRSDVVHVHTNGANPSSWILAAAVGAAGRAARARVLVTLHSGHGPRWITTVPRVLAVRLALAPYDRVVCVSEEIARTLQRIDAAANRIVVAPAFGAEGLVPGLPPAPVAAFREAHPEVVCAMLAPGEDYGARELFEAFAELRRDRPRAGLAVYGPGTDSPETRALARLAGAVPSLFLGEIRHDQALGLMASSRLFVRPTRVDGDAVSVREALALGVAVAATDAGTRPPGVHLCTQRNPAALAAAMRAALAAPPPARATAGRADGIAIVLSLWAKLLRAPGGPARAA